MRVWARKNSHARMMAGLQDLLGGKDTEVMRPERRMKTAMRDRKQLSKMREITPYVAAWLVQAKLRPPQCRSATRHKRRERG